MHNFLKKIFSPQKTEAHTIPFDNVPAWLSEREGAAKATLVSGTKEPMTDIRNAVAHLHLITNDIAGAEHDAAVHPKLKTIAKNSLPQFVKSMKSALTKDLPEDPEEFYVAAAECLKNCLHNTRGPGRYLQMIFPEEMKAVRQGIDAMGRGINTLNPLLASYRKEVTSIAAARALYDAIVDLKTDLGKSEEKLGRLRARIIEINERCGAIDQELSILPRDSAMKEIEEKTAGLASLIRDRDDTARTYSALSMTASHVLRKAEKIATRQRHPSEIAILNTAMEILSDHEIPGPQPLEDALLLACPIAERMIASGEVVLKNKDERAIFSDTARFRADIGAACVALRSHEEQCHQAESALASHPLTIKQQSLERERAQLISMLEKENQTDAELKEWQQKTERRIPELLRELRKKVGEMSGDNVQLQENDPVPV
ncbi:MAG TPA: hypothetical protein VHN82_02115 [Methanoregula sp.]|nr:hypothetical protein [Methanoregula sp.]